MRINIERGSLFYGTIINASLLISESLHIIKTLGEPENVVSHARVIQIPCFPTQSFPHRILNCALGKRSGSEAISCCETEPTIL